MDDRCWWRLTDDEQEVVNRLSRRWRQCAENNKGKSGFEQMSSSAKALRVRDVWRGSTQ